VGVCFAPCDSKSREPVFQILGSNSRWAVRHEIALLTTNFLSSSSSGKPDSKSSWTSSDDDVTSDMKSLFQRTEALSSHSFRPCRFNAHQPTRPPHEGKHSYNSTSTTIWNSVKTLYFAVLCLLANPVGCITHGPLNSVRPQIVPSAWGLHWAWCSTTSNRTDYNTYETFIMDYASSRSEIVAGWSMGRLTVGQVWMIGCLFDEWKCMTENRAYTLLLGHLPIHRQFIALKRMARGYSCLASKQTVLPRAIRTALHPEYRSATTTNRTSGNWIAFRRVFVWIVSLQYSKHDLKSRSQYWQRWQEEVVSIKPSPSNFRKDLPYIFSLRG
jgi:hypothetical protein